MAATNDEDGLFNELDARTTNLNQADVGLVGELVLVWLSRSLRALQNPAIDAGVRWANTLDLPLVVYSEVHYQEPYASDRLHFFALGANRDLGKQLSERGITHVFDLVKSAADEQLALQELEQRSAVIVVDEQFPQYEREQNARLAERAKVLVQAVDATRLIPHSALGTKLHVTKVFRAAHSPLRQHWIGLRKEEQLANTCAFALAAPSVCAASLEVESVMALLRECDIDHTLPPVREHLPTQEEVVKRVDYLATNIVETYRAKRNNPALPNSTSELSPYLHYGMVSVWQIIDQIEQQGYPRSPLWKFYDELLTWREWSHWRLADDPSITEFHALPKSTINTLDAHRDDQREVVLTEEQLFNGLTPDDTWNAAQKFWRDTGWLHNNLRMYWAKQFLRWTATPEEAWHLACKFNDRQSLDGLDPATYMSMRWAFGEAKPGYSEQPVYGWVAKRSNRALKKRAGYDEWESNVLMNAKPDIPLG